MLNKLHVGYSFNYLDEVTLSLILMSFEEAIAPKASVKN
jgi:hypothetical protein